MELYQLRTFLAIADEGNLTRAAEKLFASQPAVSAQLKSLEDELGVRLFDRSAKGTTLTAEGAALHAKAKLIVNAARDFKHNAESLRGTVSGELTIGLNNRPEILRLMESLGQLTRRYPELSYELVNSNSGVILQGIEEGAIAIGFFEGPCYSDAILWHPLQTIELCIAAPAEWAKELSNADWKWLESKPWIFVSPSCSYCRAIEHFCREQGLQLRPRFRVNEDLTVLNLVAEGLGLTITSRKQIETAPYTGKIVALPHYRASVDLCIGYLKKQAGNPAIAAVRDSVLEAWAAPADTPNAPSRPTPGSRPPARRSSSRRSP